MIYTLIACPYYMSLSVTDSHLVDIFSVLVGVVERERVVGDKARITTTTFSIQSFSNINKTDI